MAALVVLWTFHTGKPRSPSQIILGFLPAVLWIAGVLALVRQVRTLDEMGKRIQMQAASVAFVATVILNFVSLGLDAAKIYTVEAGALGSAGILIWAVAVLFLTLRYQ